MSNLKGNLICGLCKGRHPLPVCEYLFGNQMDPFDFQLMYNIIADKISNYSSVTLYVTGLTSAVAEVIKVCKEKGINLTLMHFNLHTNSYIPQKIWTFERCPFCGNSISENDNCCSNCGAS